MGIVNQDTDGDKTNNGRESFEVVVPGDLVIPFGDEPCLYLYLFASSYSFLLNSHLVPNVLAFFHLFTEYTFRFESREFSTN